MWRYLLIMVPLNAVMIGLSYFVGYKDGKRDTQDADQYYTEEDI